MSRFVLIAAAVALIGCSEARNLDRPGGELKHGANGMTYVLTCVEGYEFIAFQGSYNFWYLSGPLRPCR